MNSILKKQLLTLTLIACGASVASADVKVKMKTSAGGNTSESVVYIKGKRQRSEQAQGGIISITQCDLKRDVQLNTMTKTYTVSPFDVPVNTRHLRAQMRQDLTAQHPLNAAAS
jgi:Na+-transporting NADH:ubiquinone oxidoreductase subunit NqrF